MNNASLQRTRTILRVTAQPTLLQLQTQNRTVILRLRKIRRTGQVEAVVAQGLAQQ